MGLAAVPFGTAQATDYEIKVTQEHTCDPKDPRSIKDGTMHFDISISKDCGKPSRRRISWGGRGLYIYLFIFFGLSFS